MTHGTMRSGCRADGIETVPPQDNFLQRFSAARAQSAEPGLQPRFVAAKIPQHEKDRDGYSRTAGKRSLYRNSTGRFMSADVTAPAVTVTTMSCSGMTKMYWPMNPTAA